MDLVQAINEAIENTAQDGKNDLVQAVRAVAVKYNVPDTQESELPLSNVKVRFQPETWENDYAQPVTIERENTWFVNEATAEQIADCIERGRDLDFVRDEPLAPSWVREWPGPFTITVIEPSLKKP